jgi:hypothetical protein
MKLKELFEKAGVDISVFLTSDWYSLESGAPWFSHLIEQLRKCDHLVTIITRPEAFRNLWINFEIGAAFGSNKFPKILVFGGVSWEDLPHPIAGLQLVDTGDGNRLIRDLKLIGIAKVEDHIDEFAKLFRQKLAA